MTGQALTQRQPLRQRQRVELKAGDTIYKLAAQYCNSRDLWRELLLYNDIDVFEQLPIGQSITIPTSDELRSITTSLLTMAVPKVGNLITEKLDLSGIKQPGTGDFSLISWIM